VPSPETPTNGVLGTGINRVLLISGFLRAENRVLYSGLPMRTFLRMWVCLVVAAIGQGADSAATAQFIGSWALISYELRLASGAVLKPFGDHPVGRILYQKNGEMSAQLMRPAPSPFANPDPLKATAEESDRAWRSYIGYWGKFRVDSETRTVVHHIEGGWFPNWIGQEQIRSFRFKRDSLILEADSPAWHATLVWRRIN
jgi:hypothetical protein